MEKTTNKVNYSEIIVNGVRCAEVIIDLFGEIFLTQGNCIKMYSNDGFKGVEETITKN